MSNPNTIKIMKKIILLIILALSLSICATPKENKPDATGESWATLVAYETHGKHKRSSAYLQLNGIETIHNVSLGRRKDPDMPLGDSIKVKYAVYGNEIVITEANIPTKYYSGRGYHSLPQFAE